MQIRPPGCSVLFLLPRAGGSGPWRPPGTEFFVGDGEQVFVLFFLCFLFLDGHLGPVEGKSVAPKTN